MFLRMMVYKWGLDIWQGSYGVLFLFFSWDLAVTLTSLEPVLAGLAPQKCLH